MVVRHVDLEARPGQAGAGRDVRLRLAFRIEDGRADGARRVERSAEFHAVRRVAPHAAADGYREFGGEEVLGAEVQLGDVRGAVGLVDGADVRVDGEEVIHQVRVGHADRIEVDGQLRLGTEGDAGA